MTCIELVIVCFCDTLQATIHRSHNCNHMNKQIVDFHRLLEYDVHHPKMIMPCSIFVDSNNTLASLGNAVAFTVTAVCAYNLVYLAAGVMKQVSTPSN